MAETRWAGEIDEARVRQANELVDQMRLEMENLINENKAAKMENHSMKAEMKKHRVLIFVCLLIICVIIGTYFASAREMEQQTTMQLQAQHTELLRQDIDELKRQIRRGNIDSEESHLEKQTSESHDWRSREMNETNELVDQIKQELVGLKSENQLAKEEIISLQAEQGKYQFLRFLFLLTVCGAVVMCFKLARDINHQTNRLADVQNWGEFVWPIDGWAAKSQSARNDSSKKIFSEAFYSHRNGYKMCLSVNSDGNDSGKRAHLSVYFCLMRGPFDNILSWPFKRDVTISLINQQTRIDHVRVKIAYNDFPNDANWNKPTNERNNGFGNSKLIELAALSSNAELCRDDKVFIRCIVE